MFDAQIRKVFEKSPIGGAVFTFRKFWGRNRILRQKLPLEPYFYDSNPHSAELPPDFRFLAF